MVLPAAAAAEGLSLATLLKDLVEHLASPEMFRALSPTEGFETKPHTFQAVETEGRWKMQPDWPAGDPRLLVPPKNKAKKLALHQATILTLKLKPIDAALVQTLLALTLASALPPAQLYALASGVVSVGSESSSTVSIVDLLNKLLRSATQLGTTALPPSKVTNNFQGNLGTLVASVLKILPSITRALSDIQPVSSQAEISAVWWSDGFEIYAGQAAAKHVTGFGSLFGHQARVELDGVSYGNYFPMSYCLTFTGFVNPVGPTFEELRGAVKLGADGNATGLFCERSNRDKDKPDIVSSFSRSGGYVLQY